MCDLPLFLPPGLAAAGTGLGGNCTGCVICSEENGCSTCQQRLFLFIRREGIRQYGKCVHDCPLGFFGIRGQEANRCKSTCLLPCRRQAWVGRPRILPSPQTYPGRKQKHAKPELAGFSQP